MACSLDQTETDYVICDRCRLKLLAALEALPALWEAAGAALAPGRGQLEPTSGSRSAPLPLSEGADRLQRRLAACVLDWVEDVADAARLADPVVRGRARHVVERATHTLIVHVDTLVELTARERWEIDEDDPELTSGADNWVVVQRNGVDAASRIIEEVRWARVWLGWTPGRQNYVGVHCPECAELGLLHRPYGSDTIACDGCGGRWTREMMDRWVVMRAAEVG